MRKLFLAAGALSLAAALGVLLGIFTRESAGGVAWAQRFIQSPFAAGKVLLDGVELKGVIGVEGVEEACQVVEVVDPATGEIIQRPVGTSTENISISFIIPPDGSNPVYSWFVQTVQDRQIEKKTGTILIYDKKTGETLRQYNFYEGWPCKWYVPDMDSDQSGMAIEKIEIAIEKVERAK